MVDVRFGIGGCEEVARSEHGGSTAEVSSLTLSLQFSANSSNSGLSYNLNISAPQIVEPKLVERHIPGVYRAFVEKVSTLPLSTMKQDQCFILYPETKGGLPNVPVEFFQQRRTWRDTVPDTRYLLDVFETQTFEVETRTTAPDLKGKRRAGDQSETRVMNARERRWGAQVFGLDWPVHFAQNRALLPGQEASWPAEEWFWFHSSDEEKWEDMAERALVRGDGFKELFGVLDTVDRMIMEG
jgi:hypothetical protein